MTENQTNKDDELEKSTLEQIKAMAKAMIVSMVWSGAELLDKNQAKDSQEERKVKPVHEEDKSP